MNLKLLLLPVFIAGTVLPSVSSLAQVTGPSTTSSPYLLPDVTGAVFTSLLTANETVGGYRMCGLLDGMGAYDNGDGTFTVVINHEMSNSAGVVRAHGSTGAFVSKWIINKSTLAVTSGSDLIQTVHLWNNATSAYVVYSSTTPSTLAEFDRFCSADLPAVSAFYNSVTGKGTTNRIFMNGEESGAEGRGFAHIVTGTEAGHTYELPYLGKFSWENSVASPVASDSTVVIGLDDATPGQLYLYLGTKTTMGNDVEKAGLTNGMLYGIKVTGLTAETSSSVPAAGTAFTLASLGDVHSMTGSTINSNSNTAGVTTFLRPEDGVWDPVNPNDFYFVTTNSFSSPSRLWRLRFTNVRNPLLGGTITAVLDGSEGQKMLDNIGIDHFGHILMQEDVGANTHNGKIWQYTIATDALVQVGSHDPARFTIGGSSFLTIDEEASGIIDMEEILGPGKFLLVDQAHYSISGEVVRGGQLLAFDNPDSYNSSPEIGVSGNAVAIVDGDNSPATTDNTNFGTTSVGVPVSKTFVINNTGAGSLIISGITFSGANASDFSLVSAPTFPLTVAAAGSYTITANFTPAATGMRNATMNINCNDVTEGIYDFAITGNGIPLGVGKVENAASFVIYPVPARDAAILKIDMPVGNRITADVLDMQGKQVLPTVSKNVPAGQEQIEFNTSTLANGIYFVRVTDGVSMSNLKLVIVR